MGKKDDPTNDPTFDGTMKIIARRRSWAKLASKPSCQRQLAMLVPFFPGTSLTGSLDLPMTRSLPPGHQPTSCRSSEESRLSNCFLSPALQPVPSLTPEFRPRDTYAGHVLIH